MNINELSYLVMSAVTDKPRHGYAILQEIATLGAPAQVPQVATLYRTIERLVESGYLIEHSSEVVDGRFRRSYQLTDDGVAALVSETERRLQTARATQKRLKVRAATPRRAGGAS